MLCWSGVSRRRDDYLEFGVHLHSTFGSLSTTSSHPSSCNRSKSMYEYLENQQSTGIITPVSRCNSTHITTELKRFKSTNIKDRMPKLFRGEFETDIYPDEWHWREGISRPEAAREMCNSWKSVSHCIQNLK